MKYMYNVNGMKYILKVNGVVSIDKDKASRE